MVALSKNEDKNFDVEIREPGIHLHLMVLPITTHEDADEVEMQLRTKEAQGWKLHKAQFVKHTIGIFTVFQGLFWFTPGDTAGELSVKFIDPEDAFNQAEYDRAIFKSRVSVNTEYFYHYIVRG